STLNTTGENLAPGYVFDLATGGTAAVTFSTATYPGLAALLAAGDVAGSAGPDAAFEQLEEALNQGYPQVQIKQMSDLDHYFPALAEAFQQVLDGNDPLEGKDDKVAFRFHVTVSATVLSRAEFIQLQTAAALKLRDAVLADPTASPALVQLAA